MPTPPRPTIIAVGASAGGLEAFIKLVKKIKLTDQVCVIFSQHLDPSHPSLSPEIISKSVKIKVVEIRNRMKIDPGCIYIQPSNTILKISKKTFGLTPRTKKTQTQIIDLFFNSMAQARHANLIGILLSGHGKDGALGLKKIKEQGGVTFVQDPASADSKEMPKNAILLKAADYVLPLSDIARTVNKALTGKLKLPLDGAKKTNDEQVMAEILGIVKKDLHVDFTLYKPSTIIRRIQRRMNVNKSATLSEYLHYLKMNPKESKLFYEDILIHVTTFFRDPKAFDRLKEDVFPEILKNKKDNQPLRIWVAGCSTGEEAYSLAMLLNEFLVEEKAQNTFQIFATDISETSIQFARTGI